MLISEIQDFEGLKSVLADFASSSWATFAYISIGSKGNWWGLRNGIENSVEGYFVFSKADLVRVLEEGNDLLKFMNTTLNER